jgi:hypothetical protein
MDGKNKVVCCFCGEQIDIKEATVIIVYPNYNSEESQEFYCHRKHLVEKFIKSIPLHPDLEEE